MLPHSHGRDTGMATRPPPASNLKARNAWVSAVPTRTEKARSYAQSSAHRSNERVRSVRIATDGRVAKLADKQACRKSDTTGVKGSAKQRRGYVPICNHP